MNFVSREHFDTYLRGLTYIGQGGQGICYLNVKDKIVYKVFHEYFDYEDTNYTEYEILRFSDIKNKTFLWPSDVILVEGKIVGYTLPYKKAKNLCQTNPLLINLNSLETSVKKVIRDISLLSDNGVTIYDLMYNTLYANGNMYVVDTLDFGERVSSIEENMKGLNTEIKLFLVDDYFNHFVDDNVILKEMYYDSSVGGIEFMNEFRNKLSEYMGEDIVTLNKAKSLVKKSIYRKYERDIK